MRAPLSASLPLFPMYAAVGFSLSFFPFSLMHPSPRDESFPWALLPLAEISTQGQEWVQGIQDPGPDLRTGMGATRAQQPTLSPPTSPATPPTLIAPAVQLQGGRGLSTSRAGGRAATLGLCLEPRGRLLLPPPALPEPSPCAACPPCPFVPKAGGGGRPTVPEAGHQP